MMKIWKNHYYDLDIAQRNICVGVMIYLPSSPDFFPVKTHKTQLIVAAVNETLSNEIYNIYIYIYILYLEVSFFPFKRNFVTL